MLLIRCLVLNLLLWLVGTGCEVVVLACFDLFVMFDVAWTF